MHEHKTHRLLTIRNVLIGLVCSWAAFLFIINVSSHIYAQDLLENAFYPAKQYETVIDLWSTTTAVGNEFFRQGVGVQDSLWIGCFINGQRISNQDLDTQISANWSSLSRTDFCQQVLGGDWNVPVFTTQAPLLVRITKRLLRITIVLSITMVIYNGIMYIVESASGAEKKDTTKNIWYIVAGILLALLSLGIINLISSITVSSL
jgi:hypothetical protein